MPIQVASARGLSESVKALIRDKKVVPSAKVNFASFIAYKNGHYDILLILWQDSRIKKTLEMDNKKIYDFVLELEMKGKIEKF